MSLCVKCAPCRAGSFVDAIFGGVLKVPWTSLAFLLVAAVHPPECLGQSSREDQSDESTFTASFYGGAVAAIGDRVSFPPWLFLVGAQLSLRRPKVEWVVLEPFGMFAREGSGIVGGLQTAWNISPVEDGPYLGFGGALLSPSRGRVGFLTGRVGIRPVIGDLEVRMEVQYLHNVAGESFGRLVNVILGFGIGNGP